MDNPFRSSPIRSLAQEWESEGAALPDLSDAQAQRFDPQTLTPPADIVPVFEQASRESGVPINVLLALAHQESSYRPDAVGVETKYGRAKGMMQYIDDTARGLGIDPFDPVQSINAAARQYAERIAKGYSHEEAIMAHHGGDDRSQWGPKTRAHAQSVLSKAEALAGRLDSFYQPSQQGAAQESQPDPDAIQAQLDAEEPGRYRVITPEDAQSIQERGYDANVARDLDALDAADAQGQTPRVVQPTNEEKVGRWDQMTQDITDMVTGASDRFAQAVDTGQIPADQVGQYVQSLPEADQEAVAAGFFERLPQVAKTGWGNMTRSLAISRAVLSDDFSDENIDLVSDAIQDQIKQAQQDQARQHPSERELKEAIEEFGKTEGFAETTLGVASLLGTVFANPKGLAIGITEQVANMLPTLGGGVAGAAAGAGTGAAIGSVVPGAGTGVGAAFGALWGSRAGVFAGTAALEYGFELTEAITDRLEKQGKQPTKENIRELLSDPAMQDEIKDQARTKGLTHAAIDAAFMGLSGKIGARAIRSETTRGRVGYGAGALATEGIGEGAAELGSQFVARGEIDKADVAAETIFGFGTAGAGAAVSTGTQTIYDRARQRPEPKGPLGRSLNDAMDRAAQTELIIPGIDTGPMADPVAPSGPRVIARTPEGDISGVVDSVAPDGTTRFVDDEGMAYDFSPNDNVEIVEWADVTSQAVAPEAPTAEVIAVPPADEIATVDLTQEADTEPTEGYQYRSDGTPFRTEHTARRAIQNRRLEGYEPVEVDGGWAIAPVGAQTAPEQAQQEQPQQAVKKADRPGSELSITESAMGKVYATAGGARIAVMEGAEFAPRANSITEFVVPEEQRGKGVGADLLRRVLAHYDKNDVSAAASSEASVRAFYREGFRPITEPDASVDRSIEIMRADSSVTMVVPREGQRSSPSGRTAEQATDQDASDDTIRVFRGDGTPFKTEDTARQAARNRRLTGYEPVQVEGGWALEPVADQMAGIDESPADADVQPEDQTTAQDRRDEPVQYESEGLPVVEVPVADLKLSDDVPQFKQGADARGVVEPLEGEFDRRGLAPLQVWRRRDGTLEVISGRHRLDLAQRTGQATVPVQIHDEADGFTGLHASILDAELNIRDGQGRVIDYVDFFRGQNYTREQAREKGLLARTLGQRGYKIADTGGDTLIAALRAGRIAETAAEAIAQAAPNNDRLQSVGIDQIVNHDASAKNAINTMQAVQSMGPTDADATVDMFGFDDSAIREAADMARVATRKQREIGERLSAITGAARRPEVARREGVDVRDPEAIKRRIEELRAERDAWDRWSTDPAKVAEIRDELGLSERAAPSTVDETLSARHAELDPRIDALSDDQAERAARHIDISDQTIDRLGAHEALKQEHPDDIEDALGLVAPQSDPSQGGMFALEGQTEQEIIEAEQREAQRQRDESERNRVADQREQADRERDDFTLTGSDRPADVLASQGQTDIFQTTPDDTTEGGTSEPGSNYVVRNEDSGYNHYGVDSRRGRYDPRQLDLFAEIEQPGRDPYRSIEVRPGTTEAQKRVGRSAIRDFFRWLTDRGGRRVPGVGDAARSVSLLGASIYKNFQAGRPYQLTGSTIRNSADLAALAQVYRDPRFETFRAFFVDADGNIVLEQAASTRMPASVTFGDGFFGGLQRSFADSGAERVYILHNHPSGSPEPSNADIVVTRAIADRLGDAFDGHIVIDYNSYSVIDAAGEVQTFHDESLGGVDYTSNPEVPHDLLDRRVVSPSDIGRVGKQVAQTDNPVVVVTRAGLDSKVGLVSSIPMQLLELAKGGHRDQVRFIAGLRRAIREGGAGGKLFVVLPRSADLSQNYQWMHEFAQDVVDSDGNSVIRIDGNVSVDDVAAQTILGPRRGRRKADLREDSPDYTERNLYVAHNLSAENILAANELGGLAAPSFAIARTDRGFDNFGEVTLLADPSMLQDRQIRAFDADIYSPRQPRAHYNINESRFNAFVRNLDPDNLGLGKPDINEVSGEDGARALLQSDAVRLRFLEGKGRVPRLYNKKVAPEIRRAANLQGPINDSNPSLVRLAEQYYQEQVRRANESNPARGERYESLFFNEDGTLQDSVIRDFVRHVRDHQDTGGKDASRFRNDIHKRFHVKRLADEYEQWVTDTFNSMVDGRRLFRGFTPSGNRRYVPYTMDNVLREMTQSLQAGENWFYGAGSVRSAYANEMRTLRDIQARRDQIISEADFEKIRDESNNVFTDALDNLKPFYKYDADSWNYMQDAGSAIAEGPRGIREAFNVTPESQKIIDDLVDYLRNLPTTYFEAKAQRAVQFGEFNTAVVPRGMRRDALQVLRDAGLRIRTYNPSVEGDRGRVIAEQERLLFSEQDQEAMRSSPTMTVDALRETLESSEFGPIIQSLVDNGSLRLHNQISDVLPGAPAGAQAFTETTTGVLHLGAQSLTADSAVPVLLHEGFHGQVRPFIGTDKWNRLQSRLGSLYRQAQRSEGRMNEYWREAMSRVDNARRMGDRMTEAVAIEEFGAYAIENYESAPRSIKKWVDDLVGAVKAWMLERFGIQLGDVTPAQLRALTAAAIRARSQAQAIRGSGRELGGSALSLGSTINVDGVPRPTMNSEGRPIAGTEEAVRNFWNWFGNSKVVDADGRPLVVYHATNSDFDTFEIGRETTNSTTFGDMTAARHAVFASPDVGFSENYLRSRVGGDNVMPLYMNVSNPLDLREGINGEDLNAIIANAEGAVNHSDFYHIEAHEMWQLFDDEFGQDVVEAAKASGFDGARMVERDHNSGELAEVWVAFEPTQIKSATGNQGTFDPANTDIRYSVAPAIETPAFRQWFGDSKVVDENGEPMVVYHGTLSDFSEFQNHKGIYFTTPDPDFAARFTTEESGDYAQGAQILPVYVAASNPFDYENKKHVDAVAIRAGLTRSAVNEVKKGKWQRLEDRTVLEAIKDAGFDGVYVNEDGVKNLAVFSPEQIKSATGNRGTFDPTNPDIRYSVRPSKHFDDLNESQKDFLDKIGPERLPQRLADRWNQLRDNLALRIRQGGVDRYAALLRNDQAIYGEDTLEGSITSSSWALARMSSAAGGALSAMLDGGRIYLDTKEKVIDVRENTTGLRDVFLQLGSTQEVERFMGWIAANRANRLMKEGRENLFTPNEIEGGIRLATGQTEDGRSRAALYRKAWSEFQTFRDDVLAIADQTGLLRKGYSKSDAALIVARKYNAPEQIINQLVDAKRGYDESTTPDMLNTASEKVDMATDALMKWVEGSVNRLPLDMFDSRQEKIDAVAQEIADLQRSQRELWSEEFYVPFYRVIDDENISGPSSSSGLSRQQAYRQLKGGREKLNNLLENTMMNFHHLLQASLKNQAAIQAADNAMELDIATPVSESSRDAKRSTWVMRDGIKQWYDISDPLTFKAMSALNVAPLQGMTMQAGRAFKRLFTNMITVTPQFITANTLRDTMQAMATSPTSMVPFQTAAQGIRAYGDNYNRARMLASGGAFSFGHVYGQATEEIQRSLRRTMRRGRVLSDPKTIPNILMKGWRQYEKVIVASENINRAGIWARNVETKGKLYAAFEARDLVDFSSHGDNIIVRIMIDLVPFLNARVQGLDKMYRSGVKTGAKALTGRGTKADHKSFARFAIVTGALSMLSMMLYLRNYDDEEYRNLEDWQRDTYWFMRFGDNAYFIPKPFEVGAIATLAERSLEQFMDPTVGGKKFGERLWAMLTDTFEFDPRPQAIRPLVEMYRDEDSFTGRPIEGHFMQRLSPSLRTRPSTTRLSEGVSRGMEATLGLVGAEDSALSPLQIDHLIRGYLGQVGTSAVATMDVLWRRAMGEELPARRWSEYQPIRRFYRDLGAPAPYTRYTTDFYNALKESDRAYADVQQLIKNQELDRADRTISKKEKELARRRLLNQTNNRLRKINADMRAIQMSKDMGAEEKRYELDRLRELRNMLTESIIKDFEQEKVIDDARERTGTRG